MRVIKIGGNELNRPGFMDAFAHALRKIGEPIIVIHGGGKEIDDLQIQLGQQPIKVQGLRRTDTDALNAAMMILCGLVSKKFVAGLINAGVDAIGLCGIDGGMLRVKKYNHPGLDLGFVGEIVEVRAYLLSELVDRGITPVISPISLGLDGNIYNVNADDVACAIAISVRAHAIDFITNMPGVMKDNEPITHLNDAECEQLIRDGAISSGMVPKVRSAMKAVNGGIPHVRIVDLVNLTKQGGTHFKYEKRLNPSEAIQLNPGGK